MSQTSRHELRQVFLGRIKAGEWALGELIPSEAILASEYGCARTTVNRALQSLADEGLLIRKRKGGTRVCSMPVRKAKIDIPIIRAQVTNMGAEYSHTLIARALETPGPSVKTRLNLGEQGKTVHLKTLHLSDQEPYAFEDRWVNHSAVPEIMDAPLESISANEWLVKTVPFSNGDAAFSAVNADAEIAQQLGTHIGAALFLLERRTWIDSHYITTVRLYYREGYALQSEL